MPALNISFTEAELARVREQARKKGISMTALAHDTVVNCASRDDEDERIMTAIARVINLSQELMRRLADQ